VVSPDGRYVLFSAIVSNSSGGTDTGIFVRDTCTGATACTPGTTRVVTGTGAQPPHQPFQADISSGGRYVLFRTAGNDIIPTYSSNLHLFEEDTCIGAPAPCTVSYTPIDVRADGTEGSDTEDQQTSLSKDGRYAVFSSTDGQIVSGGTLASLLNVYVRDTCVGAASGCVPATTLVSADPVAQTKGYRSFLGFRSVSEHGRYVAFTQDMLDTTVNSIVEIIRVRDTCIGAGSGCVPSFSTVSNDPNGTFGVAHTNFTEPSISADGHYVVFVNANGQVYLATTGY
jgi:Tol biopolymer transport system component